MDAYPQDPNLRKESCLGQAVDGWSDPSSHGIRLWQGQRNSGAAPSSWLARRRQIQRSGGFLQGLQKSLLSSHAVHCSEQNGQGNNGDYFKCLSF